MVDSGPDGPDETTDESGGTGTSASGAGAEGNAGSNLRIIPPEGESQPGVRTRRTAPRPRPSDESEPPRPSRSLNPLELPLPAMAPGTAAGRSPADEAPVDDGSPIIRVESAVPPAEPDTDVRRRRRRDRTERAAQPPDDVVDDDTGVTEATGATFDYDATTEYHDPAESAVQGSPVDESPFDVDSAVHDVAPPHGDGFDDDGFGEGGFDEDGFDEDDDVTAADAADEIVDDEGVDDESDVVSVVTDKPRPARNATAARRGPDGPSSRRRPAVETADAGGTKPNPYVKVGVGLAFGAVALAVLVFGGRPGFAFMVAALVVWVSVEYQMALDHAVRLTEIENVPVTAGATGQSRRGAATTVLTLSPLEPASLVAIVAAFAMVTFGYLFGAEAAGLVAAVAFVAATLWGIGGSPATSMLNASMSLTSIGHIAVMGTFGMLTLRMPHGFALLIVIVVLTIVSDASAYGFGSWIGRRPFFPSVSPNKSLEGFVASALVTVIVAAIAVALRPVLYKDVTNLTWTVGLLLGATAVVFATLGDLAESLIKRSLGIKDMASLLPGHGGMFDRFDAALFVMPVAYLVLWLTGAGSPT